jgi:hypothetical protein
MKVPKDVVYKLCVVQCTVHRLVTSGRPDDLEILRTAAVIQGEKYTTVHRWVNMPNRNFLLGKKNVTSHSYILLNKSYSLRKSI